jgi:Ca-activated chloride channel family protein
MSAKQYWKFRKLRTAAAASIALLVCCETPLPGWAQVATAQTQSAVSAPLSDPTRAELQPRLDVDRDPIPSPDAEDNAPVNANVTAPLAPAKPGEIQKRQDGVYTMHQDVDEVLLNCAVVDEKGRSVEDLNRGDFRIFEDGVPQTATSFAHQDQPVSMGILVDNSGSMRDKRAAVNAAALNLLRASNPRDSAFIVNFSERAYLDQGFTSNLEALDRGLSHFDSKGPTALYDAVAASADELAHHAKLPKQVLLVITDGADNASHLDLVDAIRRVQNLGGPVVYTIGLLYDDDKDEANKARLALEKLSRETGGIAYFPNSLGDVNQIAAEVARDIRDQYTIGYHSTKSVDLGGYRTVRVEASAPRHGRMTVRTRAGYYARKPAPPVHTQTAQDITR